MKKYIQRLMRIWIGLGVVLGLPVLTYALTIQQISVQGNTFIPDTTILSRINSEVGLPYNTNIVSEDIQKIYDIGFFSTVDVEAENVENGLHLIFLVEEYPFISSIEFHGNKILKDEKLEEVLTLSPADLSDAFNLKFYPVKIQEDLQNLFQLYHKQGFRDASITSKLVPDPEDPQEKVILQYHIDEQQRVIVLSVGFEGNTAFADEELRKIVQTQRQGIFSFLTGSGKYKEETLEQDLDRLRFFYIDHGYLDVQVKDYRVEAQDDNLNRVRVIIPVEEKDIYTIRDIQITGNTLYTEERLRELLTLLPGDPFSRSELRNDIFRIADLYGEKGHVRPFSENTEGKLLIDPDIQIDEQKKEVNITYRLREGEPHTVNRIMITGNRVTRDKVIRRELKLQEGDLFDREKLIQSQQRVFNLALFDDLQVEVNDGSKPYTIDVLFKLTERSSIGSFNFGGGWDTVDHWTIMGGVSARNLFGLAHTLEFSATLGTTSTLFNIDYFVPRVLDSRYSFGFDVYNLQREYSAYDSKSTGGGIRFGRRITDNIYASVKYRYEQVKISNVGEDASARIKEAEGLSTTSGASLLLRRSTINNVLLPTKGMRTELRGEVAGGIFGADNDFYKISLNNNIYFPLYKDVALRLKGEYAYVKEYGESAKVPIFERLYGGGASTIRGFKDRSIGPKDENGESIGGNTRIVLTSEIIIPIQDQMRFLTFFDIGDVYGPDEDIDFSTFRKGVGVGARISTPLGLFRLDWGYKLDREEGESTYEWHFGLGNLF